MRWTKGQPLDKAPCDTPVLVAYYPDDGRKPAYAVVKRSRGAWRVVGGIEQPSYTWAYAHDGRIFDIDDCMRFWLLPGREHG